MVSVINAQLDETIADNVVDMVKQQQKKEQKPVDFTHL